MTTPIILGSITDWSAVKIMPVLHFALLQLCKAI